jgi:hypothetical protein
MKKLIKRKAMKIFLLAFLLFAAGITDAQIGIGIANPAASAQLDVSSTTKGLLPPRMTQAQRENISTPAAGLMVYQMDNIAGFYYFNGSSWKLLSENTSDQKSIPVLIAQDDFSFAGLKNFWNSSLSGKGVIQFNANGTLTLATDGPNIGGTTIAQLYSKKQKSVNERTLVFSAVVWTYRDAATDGVLPRGLVNGTDRNNAIEFININENTIQARTVSGGTATTTDYAVGAVVSNFYSYTILASKSKVEFYFDGSLIATHTTNIPAVPLNMYFDTSTGLVGSNIPHVIDDAKFEIVR